ncbi:hypothetical protein [Poritiphilus flavus]|uniref:TfoX N-terminal domain-containing protein n=1 Tax=Poritiphilus flavus TaxID=2697053 RepID=A0A6L9E8A5_9FLAO|nr:hypothetical protein [Poritiphilus flavus]NAS10946.1 hypothetical protein [Poritiphilus flavus]
MELKRFESLRNKFCERYEGVTHGKMMSSPAIHYKGKVFAFFSRKKKMVFKLGEVDHQLNQLADLKVFSPFKNKKPLTGWYESDYKDHKSWETLALQALEHLKGK